MPIKDYLKKVPHLILIISGIALGLTLMVTVQNTLEVLNNRGALRHQDILKMKTLSQEQMDSLRPDFRNKLKRYLERNEEDSLLVLKKDMQNFEKDKKTIKQAEFDIQAIKNLILNQNYDLASNAIITLKGNIEKIRMFDARDLQSQIDSLRFQLQQEKGR